MTDQSTIVSFINSLPARVAVYRQIRESRFRLSIFFWLPSSISSSVYSAVFLKSENPGTRGTHGKNRRAHTIYFPVYFAGPTQRTGCRIKKLRTTSSTFESAGSVFQRSMYSGLPRAAPPNNKLLCRIGQSL